MTGVNRGSVKQLYKSDTYRTVFYYDVTMLWYYVTIIGSVRTHTVT